MMIMKMEIESGKAHTEMGVGCREWFTGDKTEGMRLMSSNTKDLAYLSKKAKVLRPT
jgi:hypothetical protein